MKEVFIGLGMWIFALSALLGWSFLLMYLSGVIFKCSFRVNILWGLVGLAIFYAGLCYFPNFFPLTNKDHPKVLSEFYPIFVFSPVLLTLFIIGYRWVSFGRGSKELIFLDLETIRPEDYSSQSDADSF